MLIMSKIFFFLEKFSTFLDLFDMKFNKAFNNEDMLAKG